jgi:hypothetical protein
MAIAGVLAWILPGAGHLYIGERTRGIIFLVTIAVTFWTGVAIGGVKNTVNPRDRSLWFLGQICAGGHTLATLAWSKAIPEPAEQGSTSRYAYGRAEEVSVVYTAICGMLNVLIILDALVRAEKRPGAVPARASPARATRSAAP